MMSLNAHGIIFAHNVAKWEDYFNLFGVIDSSVIPLIVRSNSGEWVYCRL